MHFLNSVFIKVRNTFHKRLKKNIFFLHVPKCGGTSIDNAISKRLSIFGLMVSNMIGLNPSASSNVISLVHQTNYPNDTRDDYPILKLRENILLYFMSQRKYKYIKGHFTFSEIAYREFKDEYAFITVIRDPVKRWLSSYFFNRFKEVHHRKIDEDIATHLQSPFGQSQGYEFVKFLGGVDPNGDYKSRQAIERAKGNLHKFDVVGLLEYREDFFKRFHDHFGMRLKLEKKNQSPVSSSYRESLVTEEIKKQVMTICEPDLEIYQYAVDNFVKTNPR